MFPSVHHNPSTLRSLHSINRAQSSLSTSIKRLSTGYRINSAKDDPAGLIASTKLSSEIVQIHSERRADQVDYYKALVADGAYGALSDVLHNAQSVLLQSQSDPTAAADPEAYQTQLDAILNSIDHFAGTISLDGSKLLDGSTSVGRPGDDKAGIPSTLLNLQRTDTKSLGAEGYSLADLASGGKLAISGGVSSLTPEKRAELAQKVLDASVTQLATQRAEVGSFMRYSIESYGNVRDITEENLQAALSQIQDADYAAEVSNFIRQRSLIDANNAVLAFGIQQSQQTLALLTPLTH